MSITNTIVNITNISEDGEYLFIASSPTNFDINKEDSLTMHVIKVSHGKEINNFTTSAGYLTGVLTKDDNAYILLNNSIGIKYNSIVVL